MSIQKIEEIDALKIPLGKLITIIGRSHLVYLNNTLEYLNINASQLHSLFEVGNSNGINQDQIASACNIDKGAIARTLRKLEEKELIIKKVDETNRRQNKIFLTAKGEEVIRKSKELLDEWEDEVLKDMVIEEKEDLKKILKKIAINSIQINHDLRK